MLPYAEANFVAALYLETPFALDAEECLAAARLRESIALPVTDLLLTEVTNAMQLHVFVARQGGPLRITWEAAAAAFSEFEEDLRDAELYEFCSLDSAELRRTAVELSLRHSARHGFRTYDLMHVASAVLLECDHFWSFDRKARQLAQLEGLAVNPWPSA